MRDSTVRFVAAMVSAILCGCARGSDGTPDAEVIDSAGVRIVTYDLTNQAVPTYRIVAEHDLEIGALDGEPEYTFSRIASLAVTDDGSIVLSDAVAQELRVYDASGAYVRTIGRRGEGPGEFAAAPLIADVAGDTVFAFDPRNARVTVLSLNGERIDEVSLRSETLGRVETLVRHDDGTYLVQTPWIGAAAASVETYALRAELDSAVVMRVDSAGVLIDTIRVMADRTRARSVESRGGGVLRTLQAPTPYSARPFLRSGGAHMLVTRSDAFDLGLLDPADGTWTRLRVLGVDHPATAEEIRAHQEAEVRASLGDPTANAFVWQANTAFLPDRLPAFTNVLMTGEGDVWVALAELEASDGYDWLVFTSAGELRGTMHTPPDFQLFHVGSDFIVGVVTDELDVPYVRRYPLMGVGEDDR